MVNTVENVDNVDTVDTVYTVYTVETVDTVDTRQGLHCSPISRASLLAIELGMVGAYRW